MTESEQHREMAPVLQTGATESSAIHTRSGEVEPNPGLPAISTRTLPFGFSIIPVAASQAARGGAFERQPARV